MQSEAVNDGEMEFDNGFDLRCRRCRIASIKKDDPIPVCNSLWALVASFILALNIRCHPRKAVCSNMIDKPEVRK